MTGIAKDARKRIVSPQSLKYCGFTPERRTKREGSTGERAMSNWATMRDIERDKPRVSDIFTRKPYGAANDLGKILQAKNRKQRRQEVDHARYEKRKAEYIEEHSEEEWRAAARGKNGAWRDANRDKLHAQMKRYREKHKDELRERRQAYYQANAERIKAKSRENYYKRKERSNGAENLHRSDAMDQQNNREHDD